MSSDSSVNDALTSFASGRMTAEQFVSFVAGAYYGDGRRATRDGLKPIVEIIERAHPGVVELTGNAEKPGFAVRLAERPFPKRFEQELRQAVQAIATRPASPVPRPGFFARVLQAIRSVFNA